MITLSTDASLGKVMEMHFLHHTAVVRLIENSIYLAFWPFKPLLKQTTKRTATQKTHGDLSLTEATFIADGKCE